MPVALLAAVALATVLPAAGGRHDRFAVAITSAHATGGFGRTRRSYVAFACPPTGRCHPPPGFPSREVVVVRFSFRVR